MQVAILGCGPAGLLAAKAVSNAGHTPIIFSKKVKSFISGAQYLARPIANLTEGARRFQVKFVKEGSGDVYTRRLYEGHGIPVRSSWHNFEDGKFEDAWSMQDCYEALWAEYDDVILDIPFSSELMAHLVRSADMVVSTIPRYVLEGWTTEEFKNLKGGWIFPHREIWIVMDWPDAHRLDNNTIYYNGLEDGTSLYRMSKINGVASAEFTAPVEGGVQVVKPIAYGGSDPFPAVVKVGRFGAWTKMQLAHHAYSTVLENLRPDTNLSLPGV